MVLRFIQLILPSSCASSVVHIVLTACASLCNNHSPTCNSSTCFSCSNNTTGSKCELCLDGYYGDAEGGTPNDCQPCECNNLAATCVANSTASNGHQCVGCRSNSIGDQCEDCESGYYNNDSGDSLTSCQECLCNGMAETCVANNTARDGYRCQDCSGNTVGDQCHMCTVNHFGDPENGRLCQPCLPQCNFNINVSVPMSCDPTTGRCLNCNGNTEGDFCQTCSAGYYGNATNSIGCQGMATLMAVVCSTLLLPCRAWIFWDLANYSS